MERWICKKCNKKWIFPVTKCVYCMGEITIEKSTQLKVIGITKVNVPSPMHPIIPYNILILQDEHGNKYPKKTMKSYNIGDIYKEESSTSENLVSIVRIKYDIKEAVEKSIELIGGINANDSSKVLIKPNIEAPVYPYQSLDTNPEVLDAVLKHLFSLGVQKENIKIAEHVLYGNFESNSSRSGISSVCRKNNIKIIDLSKTEFVKREIEGRIYMISKEVFSYDIIVNLPVLKTNVMLGISGALENMHRVVDIDTHLQMCNNGIEENIVFLNKLLPKYITIADASNGIQGQGPLHLGESAFMNMIFASNDPIALDRVFCEVGMLQVPDYLNLAEKIGLGKSTLKEIGIVGEEANAVKFSMKKPEQPIKIHSNIPLYCGKVCSICFNAALDLSKLAGIGGYDIHLVVGNQFNKELLSNKERIVAFGDNAIEKLAEFGIKPIAELKGHPPDAFESILVIKKLIENKDAKINVLDKFTSKLISKTKNLFN